MNSMQHLSDGGFGRLFRSHRHLALGWLLLAASFETVRAQSADLFFEGVLLVELAPSAEVIVPVAAGRPFTCRSTAVSSAIRT